MEEEAPAGGMPAEVTRPLGTVWKRYAEMGTAGWIAR